MCVELQLWETGSRMPLNLGFLSCKEILGPIYETPILNVFRLSKGNQELQDWNTLKPSELTLTNLISSTCFWTCKQTYQKLQEKHVDTEKVDYSYFRFQFTSTQNEGLQKLKTFSVSSLSVTALHLHLQERKLLDKSQKYWPHYFCLNGNLNCFRNKNWKRNSNTVLVQNCMIATRHVAICI